MNRLNALSFNLALPQGRPTIKPGEPKEANRRGAHAKAPLPSAAFLFRPQSIEESELQRLSPNVREFIVKLKRQSSNFAEVAKHIYDYLQNLTQLLTKSSALPSIDLTNTKHSTEIAWDGSFSIPNCTGDHKYNHAENLLHSSLLDSDGGLGEQLMSIEKLRRTLTKLAGRETLSSLDRLIKFRPKYLYLPELLNCDRNTLCQIFDFIDITQMGKPADYCPPTVTKPN